MQDRARQPDTGDDLPRRVAEAWPTDAWRDVNIAVAVSGGADSVALLHALAAVKRDAGGRGALTVVHLDHGQRGAESAADARWVAGLAEALDTPSHVVKGAVAEPASEEALRQQRRAFYQEAADAIGARYLTTGHTADDQAETVLFRALRGSGLRGLAGVGRHAPLTSRCGLVRPLLSVTRAEVDAYLASLDQPHREDRTNADLRYTRNWLRHRVRPLLAERFPDATRRLATLAEHAAEAAATIETLAAELLEAAASYDAAADRWRIEPRRLAAAPELLATEALRLAWRRAGWPEQAMTAGHWKRLAEHVRAESPSPDVYPGDVRLQSKDDRLVLARVLSC